MNLFELLMKKRVQKQLRAKRGNSWRQKKPQKLVELTDGPNFLMSLHVFVNIVRFTTVHLNTFESSRAYPRSEFTHF